MLHNFMYGLPPPAPPEIVQPNGPGDDFRGLPHLILTCALPGGQHHLPFPAEKTGIPRGSALAQGLKAAAGVDQDLWLPGACSTGGLTCSFRVGHLVSLCPNRGKTARRCGAMCWGLDGAGGKLIPGSGGPPIPTSLLSLLRVQNSFLFRVCLSRVEKELGPALCTPRAKSLPGISSHKPAGTLMVFPSQIAGSAGGESWNTCSARQGPKAT